MQMLENRAREDCVTDGRTFQLEKITRLWDELEPLAATHLREVGSHLPLKLERERYENMEQRGVHLFHTARINGALVGYCSTVLSRCFHDAMVEAHEDGIYVTPDQRGFLGTELEHWVDDMLRTHGVVRSFRERIVGLAQHLDPTRALRRGPVGYHPHSIMFKRELSRG